jgi:hypothetical protein
MEIAIVWFLLSLVVAVAAQARGRSGLAWCLVSIAVSPAIGLLLVLVLPTKANQPTPETHVRCPDCKELVFKEARKCKHCGCALRPSE